jgi:hypothetical protein
MFSAPCSTTAKRRPFTTPDGLKYTPGMGHTVQTERQLIFRFSVVA